MKSIMFSDKRRFFYDCEFMEEPGFLQLISIGVVNEDGGEFYACNINADFDRANSFVKDHVIPLLPNGGIIPCGVVHGPWMDEKAIKTALLDFILPSEENPIEFWGYYSDYDHVLLCWLFGRMVDLPLGMPMFTLDIKQLTYHMRTEVQPQLTGNHNALEDAKWNRDEFNRLRDLEKFDL